MRWIPDTLLMYAYWILRLFSSQCHIFYYYRALLQIFTYCIHSMGYQNNNINYPVLLWKKIWVYSKLSIPQKNFCELVLQWYHKRQIASMKGIKIYKFTKKICEIMRLGAMIIVLEMISIRVFLATQLDNIFWSILKRLTPKY